MAGASDKARFYLEQSVPELQDFEKKKIFSKEEISSIAKKRSDFEHVLNARGSKPADYARYAEYEMNLETLRRKRVKRLGIKFKSYAGSRRIFFVLDRGTRKFQGDLGLWMQSMEFAKKEKSHKKLRRIISTVLSLHPTKPELWIYAAHYAMEDQADMRVARAYMQRGLRFCKRSKALWLGYAKLEMIYVAKIAARQQILGLDHPQESKIRDSPSDESHADKIALPDITVEDVDPELANDASIDQTALQKFTSSPALTGAIPITVFDAAMKEFDNDAALAEQFFNMFSEFEQSSALNILRHVLQMLQTHCVETLSCAACLFRLPLITVEPASEEFPMALGESLGRLKQSSKEHPQISTALAERAVRALLPLVQYQNLDDNIYRVLNVSIRQNLKTMAHRSGPDERVIPAIRRLEEEGRVKDASILNSYALECWPSDARLQEPKVVGSSMS
ncbi:MAG: hypothetical protein Q9165_007325 [Trypethelium subeluteriae]